jgi:acetyl-CoA carboxylase alpha subunit
VGEGGSGGAIALGHADRAFMLSGSVFSVIGPEAAAVILDRDAGHAPQLADALGITGTDLLRLGVIDELLPDAGTAALAVIRTAVLDAIGTARPGDRATRTDRATAPWLRRQPDAG